MKKFIILFLLGAIFGSLFVYKDKISLFYAKKEIEQINSEEFTEIEIEKYNELQEKELSPKEQLLQSLPDNVSEEKLLKVPFVCQNPFQDEEHWKYHDNSCEEAAVLQAVLYFDNKIIEPKVAHEQLLDMIKWQEKNFGTHKDIKKEDLRIFARDYFGFNDEQVVFFENSDKDLIKKIITMGIPIIMPTTAKDLHNPYYQHPGYHMLTVIGYTKNQAITNDVGTKRGEKFPYSWEVLLEANETAGGGFLIIIPNNSFKEFSSELN